MKRIGTGLLALLLFLIHAGCGGSPAPSESLPIPEATASLPSDSGEAAVPTSSISQGTSTPLMWRVEGNGTEGVLYLFGSIHVGQDDMYPLPDPVTDAYEASDALAVECDIVSFQNDLNALAQYNTFFQYSSGDTVKNHMSQEGYAIMESFLKENSNYGNALPLFQQYNLAFWSSLVDEVLLAESGLDSSLGLDAYFLNRALGEGKEILEIESIAFQFQILSDVPDTLQEYMILQSIQNQDTSVTELQDLYEAVRTGSQQTLEDMLLSDDESEYDAMTEEEKAVLLPMIEAYNKAMYDDRNAHMAQAADTYLKEGKQVFYVVGMAHMLGDTGLVSTLTSMGYEVTPVNTKNQ